MNMFILIVSCITGITSLFSLVVKLYLSVSNIEKRINKWDETLNQNTLYIMKLALYTEGLSLTDRIQSGQAYLNIKQDYLIEKKYKN